MASRFQVPDRDQVFMTAVSYREVLGEDHLVWTVIEVVDGLDMSEAYARYEGDPTVGGRPALDPRMLLSLLVFGYREGKRSSRELEEACRRDWAYRAICGDVVPDHATIARFRQRHEDSFPSWFAQVLAVCAEAGLVDPGVVALDGTKMGSAASREANRTAAVLERLETEARVMLDQAAAADRGPGSETGPGWSSTRREAERAARTERIRKARELVAEAETKRVSEEKKRGEPRQPRVGNVTDPDSRLMKTSDGGWIQGFNAQAVATAGQIVIAAQVTTDANDVGWFEPMLIAARINLDHAGIGQPIGVALADAGYWSAANATRQGLAEELLIATTKSHRVGTIDPDEHIQTRDQARIQVIEKAIREEITITQAASQLGLSRVWTSTLVRRYRTTATLDSSATITRSQMETKLADPANRDRYRQRGWIIEGCFAHVKVHRHTRTFLRRGLPAVNAEWQLMHLAGNIDKLHRHRRTSTPSTPPEAHLPPRTRRPQTPTAHRRRHRPHRRTPHQTR